MPVYELTSPKTGQTWDVDFDGDPQEADMEEAVAHFDTEFYKQQGLDPSIADQGPVATAGNAFARDVGGAVLDAVGGVAKGAAETKRALGPVGDALRVMPGIGGLMSLGNVGDDVAGFTDAVRDEGRAVFPTNPANPIAATIGSGAGQALAIIGTAGAAAPVMGTGAAMALVPSALGGAMGLGSGIDTAKDLGIDDPAGRLALGAAFGGAEALTERFGGIGGKVASEALAQGVKATMKQGAKSVLSEAIEEPVSGTLQDAATFVAGQFVEDPARPGYTVTGEKLPALDAAFLERRKQEAIGGAAGGAVFAGIQMAQSSGQPAPITGMEEHVSDLTAEDVADIEEANRYANPQDPSLSPETIPGNLGEDVTPPTRFTDTEAADRVRRIEASLHSRGELPTGQKLLPATTGELDQLGKGSWAAFAEAFAGLFRRRVVVLKGLGADQFGGVTNDQIKDTVFINANSPRAIHSLVGHEMVHHLEVAHPDLFQRLDDVLQPDVQRMDQARKTYAGYAGKGDLNVRREIYADLMGESMSDPAFWDRLGQHEPGLFMPLARSVWRWFKDVVTALKRQGWEASQHFRDVQRAQAALAEAMAEFARRENGLTPQEAQRVVNGLLSGDNFFEGLKAPEIMGPNEVKETQSRFARPEQRDRFYENRQDVTVRSQSEAWLDGRTLAAAVDALATSELPDGIASDDVRQQAIGQALMRATAAMQRGDEFARTQARVLANKAARLYQDAGRESARALRQRSVMNAELVPIAPVLAAESLLIDRADSVMDKRFEGGAKGGAAKVDAAAKKSGKAGGEELAGDLDAETVNTSDDPVTKRTKEQRRVAARQKHPNLARMLNELRKKMYPGMKWQAIFEELPSQQRERQREIYARLRKDERLRNLTSAELVGLTNELDKAWQRERRKVFLRELEKAGALGEKDATDRQKIQKSMPKLLRAINLGLMNSETFREAVATEYGLKMISGADAAKLRTLAEEAYALPEGLMQNRKLADLLSSLQKTTGVSRAELLNSYWVAAVLSGSRTMFDTFASVINGLGTQAIQTAMLAIRQGNPRAAFQAMQQWFWGLRQGFWESGQILSRADYSYQKRFNADLNKALEGESTFRPVPLGEALWKDGNWFEKWGMAPVMMWTGRLMAAADHMNNTATTAGAMAVARALHPEIYEGKAGFTAEEKAAALAQAKREMLGGEERVPGPHARKALTCKRGSGEILAGNLRPEERKEASFIGDQAAYQNDPTGLFGAVYEAVNMALGHLERKMAALSNEYANPHAQSVMLFLSGALRSAMGAKFIRFGANFANDTVSYIPGTMLTQRFILGKEATASQKQLLLGKNIFGLMLGLSLAAMFLGKDDEEEGWHSEGGWLDLTPDEAKQRRAAGFEPFTFWRRVNGKIERLSYKQWPTAGLVAAVAHMQDRRRFAPEKWEREGMTGHLLAAASVGLLQVKEAAAMRGLAELMGGNKFGPNPEEDLVERLAKVPSNFAGGFIPTLVKDFDLLADPQRYKPEGIFEDFIRNVPVVRRSLAGGRPELNILGVPILQDRKPWSRTYTQAEHGVAHVILSKLMARGYQLPVPSTNKRVFVNNAWTTIDALGGEAEWKYQKYVGEGYATFLTDQRELLMKLQGEPLKRFISNSADRIKSMAAMRVADQSK